MNAILRAIRLALPLPLLSAAALAQAAQQPVRVEPLSAGSVFSVLFGLVVVVGLLLGTAWLLRRFQGLQQGAPSLIQPVAQMQLGLKERVLLIRIDQENVLIGCTPQGIRALHAWQGPMPQGLTAAPSQPAFAAPAATAFVDHLRRLLAERKS